MKIFIKILVLILFIDSPIYAQKEINNWYFGNHAGVSFNTGSPVPVSDGKLNSIEGCAVMSDKNTGKLLFYTDGTKIWNANHQVVNTDIDLMGGPSSTQTVLIVPNPANNFEYYIFTVPDLTLSVTPKTTSMYYSLISVQNPSCDIVFINKFLIDGVSEKLTGTVDCSGTEFWVVAHSRYESTFYSFHVTSQGVNEKPVTSNYYEVSRDNTAGYVKISPDGSKLAITSHNANSFLALFDFDVRTGAVSNYILLGDQSTNDMFYGVSFSPDNSKLYAIGRTNLNNEVYESALYQYEVNQTTPAAILNSLNIFYIRKSIPFVSALLLGPDKKLYIACTYRNYLDVINYPNLKGNACGYKEDAVKLTGQCQLGLPNNMDLIYGFKDTVESCTGILIGKPPTDGYSYSWSPVIGLSNPNGSQTIASPTTTTSYILKETNTLGCVLENSVLVKVKAGSEHLFQLNPPVVSFIPGKTFETTLHSPSNVGEWEVHLKFDSLLIKFDSILQTVNVTNFSYSEQKGSISLKGNGENGDIAIRFNAFLPQTTDSIFKMDLVVVSAEVQPCERASARSNLLQLGNYCAKTIRSVSSTGKDYFLNNINRNINFGVGLTGNVRIELYNYTGTLEQVLVDNTIEAGEYSIDLDTPIGVYFVHLHSGMFNNVQKVVVVR